MNKRERERENEKRIENRTGNEKFFFIKYEMHQRTNEKKSHKVGIQRVVFKYTFKKKQNNTTHKKYNVYFFDPNNHHCHFYEHA